VRGVTRRGLGIGLGAASLCSAVARAQALKSPARNAAALPKGVFVDRSNPAIPMIYIREDVVLDQWDLRGYTLFVDQPITGKITRSQLAPPQARANLFGQGQNDPAHNPRFAIVDCDIDLASNQVGYFNGLLIYSGSFELSKNRLRNASVSYVNFQSATPGGTFLCEDNVFGAPGVNATSDPAHPENNSHCEAIVVQAGTAIIRRNRFDPGEDAARARPRTMTGQMLIQGQFGAVDVLIEGNHVLGSAKMRAPYAIQAGGGKHPTRLRLIDNVMEAGDAGPGAYLLVNGAVSVSASGNRDFKTGRSIL
jgi:hypothetical protein